MILLVEDELSLARGLIDLLRLKGHQVEHVTRAEQARQAMQRQHFQLLILDAGLPDGSGFDLLAQMRRCDRQTLVLMLTARSAEADRVLGFELGVDDYLCKPFSMAELLGRIGALLRRANPSQELSPTRLQVGTVEVDLERFTLTGTQQAMPARAFRLLKALADHRGQVLGPNELMDLVWGAEEDTALKTLQNLIV